MKTLHIAPGQSAGGSLIEAIDGAGRDDEVLSFRDDLSCGPIDPDDPSIRADWWGRFHEAPKAETNFGEFWDRVAATNDRLIVWFGRHSALELSFFLAWADRLGERPYQIIDVTGRTLPLAGRDGSPVMSRPVQAVSIVPPDGLGSLLDKERPITAHERAVSRRRWQRLRRENAPFRIVTGKGLVSASNDHFDPLLLAEATPEWQKLARLVGCTMGNNSDRYFQAGDLMLHARVVALVSAGRLLADGDPWDMSCRIRLADRNI